MKNCNKQNEKIELVDEKTLVIGVDIGSYDEYARAFTCYRKLNFTGKSYSLLLFSLSVFVDYQLIL